MAIETERRTEFSQSRRRLIGNCAECEKEAVMLTADEAAALSHVSMRTIYNWVESGKIHFLETQAGSLLVCLNSLTNVKDQK